MIFGLGRSALSRMAPAVLVAGSSARLVSNSTVHFAPKRRAAGAAAVAATTRKKNADDPPVRQRQRKTKEVKMNDADVAPLAAAAASVGVVKAQGGTRAANPPRRSNKKKTTELKKHDNVVGEERNEVVKPPPSFTVDLLRLINEWGTACANIRPEEMKEEETAGDTKNVAVFSSSTTAVNTEGTTQFGAATLTALLARVFKFPEEYPTLHNILQVHQQQSPSQEDILILHVTEIVRNVDHLSTLIAFLRVYRTSAFSHTPLYEAVMGALVQAATKLWCQEPRDATNGVKNGIGMKTILSWILLELRKNYFEVNNTVVRVTTVSDGKRKREQKKNSSEHKKWLDDTTQMLLTEVAVSVNDHIAQETNDRELRTLTEGVVNLSLVVLIFTMSDEVELFSTHLETWKKSVSRIQSVIDVYLNRISSEESLKVDVKHIKAHGIDLLDALRFLSMVDTVLSPRLRERMKRAVVDCFLKLCGAVSTQPGIFTEILCTSEIVQRVRALPSKDLIDAIQSAIFTGAALFCECADDDSVSRMIQHVRELKGSHVKRKCDVSLDSDGVEGRDESDDSGKILPQSRRAIIAYALFSVGFDPEAVLSSGLCVGHDALEALELLRAAAFFSRSFALSPLPPRLSTLLTSESKTLIEAHIRAENRAGNTGSMDFVEGLKPLGDLLEHLPYEDTTENLHNKNSKNKKRGGQERNGSGASIGMIFHLALGTTVELLVRGEEKKLSAQLVRLLTLLEWEGSYNYLVDGFSRLIDGFVERFHIAGKYQQSRTRPTNESTSLEVERSLSEVTALFVPRVVEAVQRQLSKTRRSSAMQDAEEKEAAHLLQEISHFTVYVAVCGMDATTAKQLVGLHNLILKSVRTSSDLIDAKLTSLSETVMRMNILVSHVAAKEREFGLTRHPASPGLRYCSIFLNDIVAAHLKPIDANIRRGGSNSAAVTQERYQVLSIVSLLFRLVSEYSVEAEPAELRAFRTDVLDPTLTRVLQQQNDGSVQCNETLDLHALSEITVVMCVPHTIHHLSPQLLDQLAKAVAVAAPKHSQSSCTIDQKRCSSKSAARLLISAAAICQLRQDKLTARYLELVQALGPLLLPSEVSAVLCSFVTFHVPSDSDCVTELRNRLTEVAELENSSLSIPERISALQILCELGNTVQLAYVSILRRIISSDHHHHHSLTPGEIGIIVRISTRLQQMRGTLPLEDLKFVQDLPISLAEVVLRIRQQCSASDLPFVLQGFSQLEKDLYGDLKDRVVKAYILRTIQLRPLLGCKEVVECLESYAAAQVSHQYLFGVLLARVTDVKLKFSLPLAVRLVQCGVNATWDKSVQTACIAAAQPVFIGLVRHLLQSDPASLPSVASTAVVVLECLAEAFPNDPTSDLLLQNMASHYTAISLSTMMAILELIIRRSSTEYNILRCMTDHAASALFPQTSPKAFAELTRLFVKCGVRSQILFAAVSKRFKEISSNCGGEVLAILAEAFTVAHVDLEQDIIRTFIERTIIFSEGKDLHFQLHHCISILKLFSHLDVKTLNKPTTLLLECAEKHLESNEKSLDGIKLLEANDINVLLSACLWFDPSQHTSLVKQCGDALMEVLESERAEDGRSSGGWQMDLMVVVQLAQSMVKLGLGNHPAVALLFDILYEKRSALMRRRLLLQTTKETIQQAGEHTHSQLYALLVEGKLVA